MWKVKKSLLEDALQASENYLPDEFMCFLGGDKKKQEITEIVLLPTYNSKNSASVNLMNAPIDDTIVGTLHSHPNGYSNSSTADKKFFENYELNIIIGLTKKDDFNANFSFYDNKGNKTTIELL